MKRDTQTRIYFCRNAVLGNMAHPALDKLRLAGVGLEPVPCSGRIDPRYILKAFESGASAVCVLTCPRGQCKLMEGNLRAARRVQVVRDFLAEAGVDPSTLQIFMADGSDEDALEAVVKTIAEFIRIRQSDSKMAVA